MPHPHLRRGGDRQDQLCLTLAKNLALENRKTIYVDSEASLCSAAHDRGEDQEKVLKKCWSASAQLDDQDRMIGRAIKLAEGNPDVGLIVVDSMTMFYRWPARTTSGRSGACWPAER